MRLEQYFETLDVSRMHAGESAPHAYFIPFDREQNPTACRTESRRFMLLNGQWEFAYYESVRDLPQAFDPFAAPLHAHMPVPGVWQMNGYDSLQYTNVRFPFAYDPPYVPADTPCGLYRRVFSAEKRADRTYSLVFEGVDSCLFLWLNGQFIGTSQVSHSPAEFDVTHALADGENTVCALVLKWCAGSYLEDQDKFRYSGIFRDVYLLSRDAGHIVDFSVQAEPDEHFKTADVRVQVQTSMACSVTCRLLSPEGALLGEQELTDGACAFSIDAPHLWTAETPTLYTLVLLCGDEAIARYVGVRRIEVKSCQVLLNGQVVRFRGVNLHESSCDTGAYTPPEHVKRDLLLMKRHHVNAVRTSHYPQPPVFYELCEQLGLYVLDEADIECHGVVSMHGGHEMELYNTIARDPAFGPAILDRVQRMVIRDRNFPCVLIYSMGNEAGYGVNFEEALRWTKRFDPSRLTHYERTPAQACVELDALDLYSRMYPSQEAIKTYFAEHPDCKPLILCEYCHAMGNGPGDLEDYFQVMEQEKRMCGGFVWEWVDHAPCVGVNEKGQKMYRYGGDFGESLHDGNFCVDGLVSSDRTVHPGLLEFKNVMRPLRVSGAELEKGKLTLRNHLDFVSPKGLYAVTVETDRGDTLQIPAGQLDIAPHGERVFDIPACTSCVLRIVQACDTPWAEKGCEMGVEQIGVPPCQEETPVRTGHRLQVSGCGERYITLEGDGFVYRYDTAKGVFASLRVGEKELLLSPMAFNIWRAPTDNDRRIRDTWDRLQYRYAVSRGFATECERNDACAVLTTRVHIGAQSIAVLADGSVQWTVHADGRIECSLDMMRAQNTPFFPRLGLRLYLPRDFRTLRYFAYGPHESYVDKHQASVPGWFDGSIDTQYAHPLRPQESGSHWGAQSLKLYGADGALHVTGAAFAFSALPFSQEQLADVRHDDELEEENCCVLCLDAAHAGIGSNSCGPALLSCYETPAHVLWHITLDPLAE